MLMPKMYSITKEKVKHSLDWADAATVNYRWLDFNQECKLPGTACCINSEMELKPKLLDCFKYDKKHTVNNSCQLS